MKSMIKWTYCLLVMTLVACGQSKTENGKSGAKDSVQVETVVEKKESSLSDNPQELADFAVECFRTNKREDLLPYSTERCKARLTEDMALEEQLKNDRGLRRMREQLQETTYTCGESSELGSNGKLLRYESNPSKYDMKVVLEMKDGKWYIDQVGPER